LMLRSLRPAPKGQPQVSPGQRPGTRPTPRSSPERARQGHPFVTPFQGFRHVRIPIPRALPWAFLSGPFGANSENAQHQKVPPTVKGRGVPAPRDPTGARTLSRGQRRLDSNPSPRDPRHTESEPGHISRGSSSPISKARNVLAPRCETGWYSRRRRSARASLS
jgi:hypothetical protein